MIEPKFNIDTQLSQEALLEKLKVYEPWRIGIGFSNGVNTSDLETMQPFSDVPLAKLKMIAEYGGEEQLTNKRVLDIGSNIGYNSIKLTRDYGCNVTGLEFDPKNIEKANLIADLCGVDVEFQQGDAGTYLAEDEFDLILHLGTLYHLPDPIGALKCSAQSLKSGGRLYIETAIYNGEDEYACRYVYGYGNDYTNFWALSPKVITEILEYHGMKSVVKFKDIVIKLYEGTGMSRALFCAEKF